MLHQASVSHTALLERKAKKSLCFSASIMGASQGSTTALLWACQCAHAALETDEHHVCQNSNLIGADVTDCCHVFVQAKGIARRLTPILVGVREEVKEDKYTLVCIRSHDHATSKSPAALTICCTSNCAASCDVLPSANALACVLECMPCCQHQTFGCPSRCVV